MVAEAEGSWSHYICSPEAERGACCYSASFLLFLLSPELQSTAIKLPLERGFMAVFISHKILLLEDKGMLKFILLHLLILTNF